MTSGVWKPRKVTVKLSPRRRRHDCMKAIGRTSQRTVWSSGGSGTAGGSVLIATASQVRGRTLGFGHGAAGPWEYRRGGESAVPRGDDVRRVGQYRPR